MKRVKIGGYQVGMLPTNFYYLSTEVPETVVFDPGDHGHELYQALSESGRIIRAIFLTHAHFDHIWGVEDLRKESGAPVYIWEGEHRLCSDPMLNESALYNRPCTVVPDRYLKDGEELRIAGLSIKVLATPGHTEGSCCYFIEALEPSDPEADKRDADKDKVAADLKPEEENRPDGDSAESVLVCGDTVFQGSVGRTDLPTGSQSALVRSIREKILPLPDRTILLPGHGPASDMASERRLNPYFG